MNELLMVHVHEYDPATCVCSRCGATAHRWTEVWERASPAEAPELAVMAISIGTVDRTVCVTALARSWQDANARIAVPRSVDSCGRSQSRITDFKSERCRRKVAVASLWNSGGHMAVSKDELDGWNREGAKDASEGRMNHSPWAGPFEPHEDHDARRDAYDAGYWNTLKQKDESSGSGGCFLTTACVEFAGLPDDCRELAVLRKFRDEHIQRRSDGKAILATYYATAPALVRAIKDSPDSAAVFASALETIRLAVRYIDDRRFEDAFDLYAATYTQLTERFLVPRRA